jgi:WD40 repeat protein
MLLLKKHCLACHNPEKKKGGLVMTTRQALLKGGDNGPVVAPGKPGESSLTQVVLPDSDPHMPPKEQLSDEQVQLLRAWVTDGAAWDAEALAETPPALDPAKLRPLPPTYRPVLALALSPDGKRLAAGRANAVVIYNLGDTNQIPAARLEGHRDAVQSLAWSPDGKQLAAGGFRRVLLWDAMTLEKSIELTNLIGRVTALDFTPDSANLITADGIETQHGEVQVWKLPEVEQTSRWVAHSDSILDLKISPDGKTLASSGADKLVKLWELPSGKEITRLEGHNGHVLALAFKSDGSLLATGGADKEIKIWDVETREQKVTIRSHPGAVTDLAWAPESKNIFSACEDGVIRQGEETKERVEKSFASANETLHTLAISPDGKSIYGGCDDGSISVWQSDGRLVQKLVEAEASTSIPPLLHGSGGEGKGEEVRPADTDAAPLLSPLPTPASRGEEEMGTLAAKTNAPLSFVNDVLPVLSKAGCNAGKCHAKPEGQNGFKLSVFAYDPKSDHREIVKDARGRRVFPAFAEESLILRKPTLALPHEGGERFKAGSKSYQTLVRWIEQGMPYSASNDPRLERITVSPGERRYRKGDQQALTVQAHYSDGSVRDVTELADFESNDKEIAEVNEKGLVTVGKLSGEGVIIVRFMGLVEVSRVSIPPDRSLPDSLYAALPVRNFIDELAYARFKTLGLLPSDPCRDSEFLRRAWLDTIGVLPTADEARRFLDDQAPDKRARLIDRLLQHPAYADHWATKWADLIRPNPDRAGVKSVFMLDQWLRESFRQNKPYDQFVREILTAQGSTHRYGPTVVFRDRREPEDITTLVSQVFLGVRLECAKCHHHPNEKWTQDDFYQFAAYFAEMKRKGTGISPPISGDFEVLYHAPGGQVKHPVTEAVMRPKPPEGAPAKIENGIDPRRALADWVTATDNPFFARAAVNRVWAEFFGRGFVDPVDDFRTSNPPSHEPLLDALARDFVQHGCDLKHLMRTIMRSHLYQLSSLPNEHNLGDTRNFSRSYRRRLPAEVLADAVAEVTGVPTAFQGLPGGARAKEAWNYKIGSEFMDAFGRPNSSSDCPCERDTKPSVVQALHMMNANDLQVKLTHAEGRAKRLASSERTTKEILTELYLAAYNRFPTPEELSLASRAFAAEDATRQSATEDLLWALLNSAEFVFNH